MKLVIKKPLLVIVWLWFIGNSGFSQQLTSEENLLLQIENALELSEARELLQADVETLRQIVVQSEKQNSDQAFIIAQKWLGAHYLYQRDFTKAVLHYQLALQRLRKFPEMLKQRFIVETGITNAYISLGRFKEAEGLQNRWLAFLENYHSTNTKDSLFVMNSIKTVYVNKGIMSLQRGAVDEGIALITDGLRKIDDNVFLSQAAYQEVKRIAIFNLGTAYLMKGNGKAARPYIVQFLQYVLKKGNDPKALAKSYGNLAYCDYLLKDFTTAYKHYAKSLEISEKHGFAQVSMITYQDLSATYKTEGKWKEAMESLAKYQGIKDSLQGLAVQKNINKLREKFKAEQKEQEIQQLSQERANAIQRQWLLVIGLCLLVLVLILGVAFFLIKGKMRKKEAQLQALKIKNLHAELSFKKQDVTRMALEICKKQDLANQLSHRVKEFEKFVSTEARLEWRALGAFIQSQLLPKEEEKIFYKNIEAINQSFYARLKSEYPQLSQADRELCSYIRLGLSNKEIATFRHVSLEAIRSSQFRLRKKLGVETKEEVHELLASF